MTDTYILSLGYVLSDDKKKKSKTGKVMGTPRVVARL